MQACITIKLNIGLQAKKTHIMLLTTKMEKGAIITQVQRTRPMFQSKQEVKQQEEGSIIN